MLYAPTHLAANDTQACPLTDLAQATISAAQQGRTVQVVFDLDDTLFLVRPRKRAIFRELADAFHPEHPTREALWRLSVSEIPYDVKEALATVGIDHPETVTNLVSGFFARFFDGEYTRHDAPNTGAAAYLNHLHAHGVKIVYLSGRPEEMMSQTIETLVAAGFPLDLDAPDVVLKAKHEMHIADAEFKGIKGREIAERGPVLASFDNEPANLNAMREAMPEATFFLLDTDHSPNPPELEMPVVVMKDFQRMVNRLEASLAATPTFGTQGWTMNVEVSA
jgi:phosphoglycolate phosphatase-like HAD superfamily hydrolase